MRAGVRKKVKSICAECGLPTMCKLCLETSKEKTRDREREKGIAAGKANMAAGLTYKGLKRVSGGWKDGVSLTLTTDDSVAIPDVECFEAPISITKRELQFLI